MAVSKDFLEYILDQLSRWGGVSVLRMFGGAGLFRDGIMFGLVANDVTYLKVDDTTKDKYVVEGSSPLKPFPDKSTVLSYYELPGDILGNLSCFIYSLEIVFKEKNANKRKGLRTMAVTKGFINYVLDQLSQWGDVSAKKLFGGVGLYRDAKMFGLIADDVAYLKVDETNRGKFVSAGSAPFKPFPKRPTILSFYEVPVEVLENSEELIEWAEESLSIQKSR